MLNIGGNTKKFVSALKEPVFLVLSIQMVAGLYGVAVKKSQSVCGCRVT